MSKSINVPKLRFKEFGGDWEIKSLSQLSEMKAGKFVKASDILDNQEDEMYPCYGGNGLRGYVKTKTHEGIYSLIGRQGALCGNIKLASGKFHATEHAVVVTPTDDNDTLWLYYELDRLNLNRFATGQAQPGLSVEVIQQVKTNVPSKQEQEKIASFLTSVDTKIEQLIKKEELLQEYKEGVMQKIFNQEIRFKADDGSEFCDWEEKKLEEVANRYDNLRIPVSSSNRISGDTPYYGANGIQDYVEGFTHDGEFVLLAEDGANDLKNYPVQYVNGKIWVNNHAHVLQGKKNILNNKFFGYAISKINIEPFLVGGGRSKLNANIMMKININIPSIEEQTKIANFLFLIDSKIEQIQKQINSTKDFKKALLQQMFV